MNKLMGAEYNRVLRALAQHATLMADATASQEDKDAATTTKDEVVAAWPTKLKVGAAHACCLIPACCPLADRYQAFQRNRKNVQARNSIPSSKKRKISAGGEHATSTGDHSAELAANTQALTGIYELGRAVRLPHTPRLLEAC